MNNKNTISTSKKILVVLLPGYVFFNRKKYLFLCAYWITLVALGLLFAKTKWLFSGYGIIYFLITILATQVISIFYLLTRSGNCKRHFKQHRHLGKYSFVTLALLTTLSYKGSSIFGLALYRANGDSMNPAILHGDLLVVERLATIDMLSLCDIVVFSQSNDIYVKRIHRKPSFLKGNEIDFFYVIGDNRIQSIDSRYFGLIKKEDIIGKVSAVFLSRRNLASTECKGAKST